MATRPATDLVKGAIFSMLESLTDNWENVLDLYSGSGGLGIEALSRGAGWVDFVGHARQCCAIIKENLDKTKFSEFARVHCVTVNKALAFLDKELLLGYLTCFQALHAEIHPPPSLS